MEIRASVRQGATVWRGATVGGARLEAPSLALPELARPAHGARLLLLKELAQGGMGELYLAASGDIEGAERPCVVKIVRRERVGDPSFLARFLDEARIQAQMQHPGVAQVLEAAMDAKGKPYVVVEHVAGHDLADVGARAERLKCPMHWADAIAIAVALAEALAHVHERKGADGRALAVVHRDLSPHNIMLSYGGEVKLIDFGTARGENRRSQTVNGVVFAKPGYVAPEVLSRKQVGHSADLYALGIVLWELTAGRRFLQADPAEHLARVAAGELQPAALAPWLGVPPELDRVVARLTARRVEDRFESAQAALRALAGLLKQAPASGGERGVRGRVARLMLRLYPGEAQQQRAEFACLVAQARQRSPLGSAPGAAQAPALARTPGLATAPMHATTEEQPAAWGSSTAAPARANARLAGTRYWLSRLLSDSPTSPVFQAHHLDLKRETVVKVLTEAGRNDPQCAEQFQREAELTAAVDHPNLVRVYDYGKAEDGAPFYAMEALTGRTLQALLDEQKTVAFGDVASWGIQVCRALHCLHQRGVVHRDVKPSNLFLTDSGILKLLDLGTATREGVAEYRDSDALQLVGTPDYMAPEQVAEQRVDARADLYSLGCVLHALLTGRPPHGGETTVALLKNKRLGRARSETAPQRQASSRQLSALIRDLLAPDARRRPQSALEVQERLLQLPVPARRKRSRSPRWAMAAAILASATSVAWVGQETGTVRALDWKNLVSTQKLRSEIENLDRRLPTLRAELAAFRPPRIHFWSKLPQPLRESLEATAFVAGPPRPERKGPSADSQGEGARALRPQGVESTSGDVAPGGGGA